MKNVVYRLIDFYVIIVQISFKITIIPYFIFSDFPYNWTLITLINGLIVMFLFLVRFSFRIYSIRKLLNFSPLLIFFALILFQVLSGLVKADFNYFIFPCMLLFNFVVYIFYLNNLFEINRIEGSPRHDLLGVFERLNSLYINFSLFQIFFVVTMILLIVIKFL